MTTTIETLEALAPQLLSTGLLILVYLGLRTIATRQVLRNAEPDAMDRPRRLLANVKSGLLVLLLVGLFFIWAPEIRTFALSLTAFAVAIILATKELILCLSGNVLRATSGAFSVGDWIEIGGIRGEVVDRTLLSTTLEELHGEGPVHEFTGRTVVVPNSQFLTTPVRNERFYKRYVIHSFPIVLERGSDTAAVERAVTAAIAERMAPHAEVAQRYNALIERRAGIDLIDLTPHFRLLMTNEGRLKLIVSVFLPTKQALTIERAALEAALTVIRAAGPGDADTAPAAERDA